MNNFGQPGRTEGGTAPFSDNDVLAVTDRYMKEFAFPIHNHDAFELDFVEHAAGARRLVGDSSEVVGEYDLVLFAGDGLEHAWLQDACPGGGIHEITVRFRLDLGEGSLLRKSSFAGILRMLVLARKGLCFPMESIMKVYNMLLGLGGIEDKFRALMQFLEILDILSRCEGARQLASSSNAKVNLGDVPRRILKVKSFVCKNYMDEIRLKALADIACMSEPAFSRFFRLQTGRTVSDYIIDIRLGYASRMLAETDKNVADISFLCGYNNLSNFNRIFKRKKGCSPTEYRERCRKA